MATPDSQEQRENEQRAAIRRKLGQVLARCVRATGKTLRQIAKETGIDTATLGNLANSSLQLRTIETLTQYLQGLARKERPESGHWAAGED